MKFTLVHLVLVQAALQLLARSPMITNAQPVSSFQVTVYWSSGPSTYTCSNGASCVSGSLSCVTFPCYVDHRITTNSGWKTVSLLRYWLVFTLRLHMCFTISLFFGLFSLSFRSPKNRPSRSPPLPGHQPCTQAQLRRESLMGRLLLPILTQTVEALHLEIITRV